MTLIKSISGIRGTFGGNILENLTPIDAVKFASAYGTWLQQKYPNTSLSVVLGRDARISGAMIQNLVQYTLVGLGIHIIDVGLSTTPTVELMVPKYKAQGGIILTASHNPKQWNALKLLNEEGEFLNCREEALELNIQGTYQNDTKSYSSGLKKDETRANFKNFNIGAKYLVYDPNKNKEDKPNLYSYHANRGFKWSSLIPAVSVAGGLNFDSEDNPYTATTVDGVSYRGVLITQNNFAGGWVFVTNFMLDRIGSDQTDLNYTLTLTHSFNSKWVMFAETQGIKSDFYADNLFRFGAGYLLGKNLQLDTALTFNTKDTPSVLNISFGVSYRIDRHDTSN